jgi:hypothetical protein
MGSIYKPRLKSGRRGRFYWIKYYRAGRPFYKSTKSEKETVARRILKAREGAIALGRPFLPRSDRVRRDEAAADLRQHYQTTGSRDLAEADTRLRPLSTGSRAPAWPRSARAMSRPTSPAARSRACGTGRSTARSPS